MKKILLTFAVFFVALLTMAQSPNLMNYQGVARNAAGNVLPNQSISLRLSILTGTPTGAAVYSETRTLLTNAFGLFNVVVGSPGATAVVGTIAGINWTAFGAGSGNKYLQVEIDPVGGASFVNVGSTQLVSAPYALNAGSAAPVGPAGGDLLGSTYPNPIIAPLVVSTGKIADAAVTTIKIADGAVTTPKLADASVTTIKIADGAVTSQKITVPFVKTQADAAALIAMTNSGAGAGLEGVNTGTGPAGTFTVNNAASTADALRAVTNGVGASWAIRATSTGTNGAGLFISNNAAATNNNLQSNTNGLGRAGLFNSTNAASTANGVDINVAGTGFALRAASTNAVPKALQTAGGLQLTGIGEANNFVLTSDATGNGTWIDPAILLPGANFWSRNAPNLFATNLADNVGIGTNTPTHKLQVVHGGATGIGVTSTAGFSVIDLSAANGDAALRYQSAGTTRWNVRNAPGTNDYQIIRNNTLPANVTINNGTGFVGITQTAPAYQLDVLHTGATGIRSQSSSTFSVVDIDAANGDAALRFQSAGTGQWNTRNRPADNYYEIFELGGGGSRMVIQDGTGNVGINQDNPAAKLHVVGTSAGIISTATSGTGVEGTTASLSAGGIIGRNFGGGEAIIGFIGANSNNAAGAVVGRNDGTGYGIHGFNTSTGIGVYGRAGVSGGLGRAARFENVNASNNSTTVEVTTNGTGYGIDVSLPNAGSGGRGINVAHSGVGHGVYSTSAGGTGVEGVTSSISAAGVIGRNPTGEAIVGFTSGVSGVGAVVGRSDGGGYGIRGFNTQNGIGVFGQSGISGGTGKAARFENVNGANTSNVFEVSTNSTGNLAVFIAGGNVARIDATGKGFFNGGTQVGGADVAEYFGVEGERKSYEPGDVLVISQTSDRTVEKSSTPYSTLVSGVYATKPGLSLTEANAEADQLESMVPMGVIGVIPTKVCLEGGAIKRGDLLVTSSTSGVAMKADLSIVKVGQVIGKALQDFDATSVGKINVLVSVK